MSQISIDARQLPCLTDKQFSDLTRTAVSTAPSAADIRAREHCVLQDDAIGLAHAVAGYGSRLSRAGHTAPQVIAAAVREFMAPGGAALEPKFLERVEQNLAHLALTLWNRHMHGQDLELEKHGTAEAHRAVMALRREYACLQAANGDFSPLFELVHRQAYLEWSADRGGFNLKVDKFLADLPAEYIKPLLAEFGRQAGLAMKGTMQPGGRSPSGISSGTEVPYTLVRSLRKLEKAAA